MYRYALSLLRDEDSAHDVVQECLMKIWKKRKLLGEIQNHEAWSMRIVRNQCLDWVKMNRFSLQTFADEEKADTVRTDDATLFNDQMNWLDKIVRTLPQVQQEIFHLREVDGYSYQEIAEITSLSLSEVKVYLHRARQKVREYILKVDNYGVAN